MKTYFVKIEKKNSQKGGTYYLPLLKEKHLFSFLFPWERLSMLIIKANEEGQSYKITTWSEDKEEVDTQIKRFAYLHDLKLEYKK